jgi:rare lipoprotein A
LLPRLIIVLCLTFGWSVALAQTVQTGMVSFYGDHFRGKRTASGERFDPEALTMAHRTFAFGTKVKITHLRSKRSVIVRVNDRGPFVRGRIADVSKATARQLGFLRRGVAKVRLEKLEP